MTEPHDPQAARGGLIESVARAARAAEEKRAFYDHAAASAEFRRLLDAYVARAVIIATLKAIREPSDEMMEAARFTVDSAQIDDQIARIYRTMIDALLQEIENV